MPEPEQRGWAAGERGRDIPEPGERGRDIPEPGERGRDIPEPGERARDIPEPGERARDIPEPGERARDIPEPGERARDIPEPGERARDIPEPGERARDIPEPGERARDIPEPGERARDIPEPGERARDIPEPGERARDIPEPGERARDILEPGSGSSSGDEAAAEGPGAGPVLKLNVGGARFRIGRRLAARFPASRIGRLAACRGPAQALRLCDDYSAERDEFFFDRDPGVFRGLCAVYRGGRPWPGLGLCPRGYRAELRYWGLRPAPAPRCCRLLQRERRDERAEQQRVSRQLQAVLGLAEPRAAPGRRRRLWRLLERPHSSAAARALAVAGCLCVLLSLACLILGTVPELGPGLRGPEAACSAALSAHLLLRLLAAPEPRRFLLAPLNAADLLALLPFYTELALPPAAHPRAAPRARAALAALRPLRLLRVLALARYSTGLRAFGFTLRRCSQQVCCLLLFIGLGIFTFSALVHQAEHHIPGTSFSSIPGTWWWAAVSISTVGYGDTIPETLLGRVFAFGCISFGIILNGMPISIFFNKFSDYYAQLKALERSSVQRHRGHVALRHRAVSELLRCCGDQPRGRRPDPPR